MAGSAPTAELYSLENTRVVVVPPPNRGGRYQIEFASGPLAPALRADASRCRHRASHALLWLIFVEGGREARREVSDVICSLCEPGRYQRAQVWAQALAPAAGVPS